MGNRGYLIVALKTMQWLLFNAVFGLAPLWSAAILRYFFNFQDDLHEKAIAEGITTFFCAAITGAVLVDYMISNVSGLNKVIQFAIYCLPVCIIAYEMLVLLQLRNEISESEFVRLCVGENMVLLLSGIYCTILKSILYSHELVYCFGPHKY